MTSNDQQCQIPHKCNTLNPLYLCSIKASAKPETRELLLKFMLFDSGGAVRRHWSLKRETRRHTWGCRSAIVRSQANEPYVAPLRVQ